MTKERNDLIAAAAAWIKREPKASVAAAKKLYGLSRKEVETLRAKVKEG